MSAGVEGVVSKQILTVGDLAATASLDSQVLAGETGLDREVLWAHSCEIEHPVKWLGPHELLMTMGLCVPRTAQKQVEFIAELDEGGLAGMMIADYAPAPTITQAMLDEADRRGFPILLAGKNLPYAVVARHVAAANSSAQTMQVLTLSKLYHLASFSDGDPQTLVDSIVTLLGVGIRLVDAVSQVALIASDLPGAGEHTLGETRSYTLNGSHSVQLLLTEFAGEELDSFLLVHLMKVLEVVTDQLLNQADRRAELSAQYLGALLSGVVEPEVNAHLHPHSARDGFRLVAFPLTASTTVSRIIALSELPVFVTKDRENLLALVPEPVLDAFRGEVERTETFAGISSVFSDFADVRFAATEAVKVLGAGQASGRAWSEFEGSSLSVLVRSQREAKEIVRDVLGSLVDDSPRSSALRETLFAYLRNDRKWSETARELSVHRQTLSYRLGRIEDETELSLDKISDIATLWIAYQAWESLRRTSAEG